MHSLFFLKICITVNILEEEKELKCKSPIELYRKLFSVIVNSFENPFHPSEDIYRKKILCTLQLYFSSCCFSCCSWPRALCCFQQKFTSLLEMCCRNNTLYSHIASLDWM